MRALLLAVILATSAQAAEVCPPACTPKTPTCDERIARATRAGCVMPETVKIVDHVVQVPMPCPMAALPAPCPPATERVIREPYLVPPPKPTGHPLLGGGPVWQNGWGATLVAGYQFKGGFQLVGGPVWLPHDAVNGQVTGCTQYDPKGKDGCGQCFPVPFRVEAQQPWGAQLLAVYVFH